MADDIFDKKKIIEALRAQGIPDKDIEKLYGPIPKPTINSKKADAFKKANAWKYDNKHKRPVRPEDMDPDYEPIEELRKKTIKKPRISKKKPKQKPKPKIWSKADEERLKALYEAGYSLEEMAKEFGTTKDAITGKLTRLRNAGWKGTIGTTHNPLPNPNAASSSSSTKSKLSPGMKKFLADALITNFGAAGRFFSKKWGLLEDKKIFGAKGGGSEEITAAVIKSNQEVISALTKLDLSLKRGTSVLTKTVARATAKMTDAVNNVVELVRKADSTQITSGGVTGAGKAGPGGGTGSGMGMIAALLGGAGLAMLMGSDHAEASVNTADQVDVNDTGTPQDTEDKLRDEGAPKPNEQTPEVEIKVKELTFDADDITFEADEFQFTNKGGNKSGVTKGTTPAPSTAPATPATPPPSSGGTLNRMMDKLTGGPGGSGFFNGLADKMLGTGGGDGRGGAITGKSPLPSDQEIDDMDKKWWNGKGKGSDKVQPQSSPGASGSSSGGSLNEEKFNEKFKGTALEGQYKKVVDEANKQGIDPALLAGVMAHETGNGSNTRYNNPGGLMDPATGSATKMHFDSIEEGIERTAKTVAKNYHKGGDSLEGMGQIYAPVGAANDPRGLNSGWASGVRKHMQSMTDDNRNASLNPVLPQDPDKNPAIKITPDVFKTGASPISPWTKDERIESMDGSDVVDVSKKLEMQPPNVDTGKQLNESQKQQDDQAPANFDERFDAAGSGKRSDASDGQNDIQTTLLETQGPNHFADYPMSDQGVGA